MIHQVVIGKTWILTSLDHYHSRPRSDRVCVVGWNHILAVSRAAVFCDDGVMLQAWQSLTCHKVGWTRRKISLCIVFSFKVMKRRCIAASGWYYWKHYS